MIEWLDKIDKELFLYLNGIHNPIWDEIMYWVSGELSWLPLYLLIIVLSVWKYKRTSVWVILGVSLVILFCDQFTSSFMKPFFARPRPCHSPEIGHLVHVVKNYCGGAYGFASSHAANSFGVAMYFFLFLKPYFRYSWSLFLWSGLVAYSRVYLGVHYPGDIIVGSLIGVFFGWLTYKIVQTVYLKIRNKPLQ